jgi:hypothetical protein
MHTQLRPFMSRYDPKTPIYVQVATRKAEVGPRGHGERKCWDARRQAGRQEYNTSSACAVLVFVRTTLGCSSLCRSRALQVRMDERLG